ncbi:AraC family transcriptional regulator [Sphingomonas sp. BAUL-RG-20F-R05-02]|uniref:AraC family transcriptional regulator n=1 Tax=Sphingomonas sp. BAUL-RG-20F-R05-02 TaxID=2914830 RepID=UPI001F5A0145|nr:AraC family transcriptional regulator [Sphingomonas sp. BAUL-RG-20F-R05-02]
MQQQLLRLRDLIGRHALAERTDTVIDGLTLLRASAPGAVTTGVFEPRVCVVLQGAKLVTIGGETFRYDPASYFVVSVAVPASGGVAEATRTEPYVAVSLVIDRAAVAALLTELPERASNSQRGFGVSKVTPALLDALGRVLDLLDNPADVAVLGSTLQRELLYRLLQNDDGQLRRVAQEDSSTARVARAVSWIRTNFDQPLRIDELARAVGMSRASLHRHFKAVTTMSPLQYQQTLRLQEGRRLLREIGSAQSSAHRVGYGSASQFSRDYARLFGLPPARDAAGLRSAAPKGRVDG